MHNSHQQWPEGLKRTRPRELVLQVLKEATQPLSALDINAAIEKQGSPTWLSTVYRVLDSFEQIGLVVKMSVMNSDMALYELNHHQHKHYAVCVDCHKVIPMSNCPVEQFVPKLKENGFQVTGHNLEIFGHCQECVSGHFKPKSKE